MLDLIPCLLDSATIFQTIGLTVFRVFLVLLAVDLLFPS